MCYIFNCFGWTLDLIQRIITFCLACFMGLVICCGLIVAITAGIAYGYNYSMAEFLTFTRSDVTVYMRRGQFADNPDLDIKPGVFRRSNEEEDFFGSNLTEYDGPQNIKFVDSRPLSDSWVKVDDTRKYAEKLTKYSSNNFFDEKRAQPNQLQNIKLASPDTHRIGMTPDSMLMTAVWRSGTSEIVMRNFEPDNLDADNVSTEDNFYKLPALNIKTTSTRKPNSMKESAVTRTDLPISKGLLQTRLIPMRFWGTTEAHSPYFQDYSREDIDEDNIVYKPV